MDGDIPDLPRFIEVKKRHKAFLYDRRGPFAGRAGRDAAAASASTLASIRRDVDIWMGTLSKALGSCGGYIAGSPGA